MLVLFSDEEMCISGKNLGNTRKIYAQASVHNFEAIHNNFAQLICAKTMHRKLCTMHRGLCITFLSYRREEILDCMSRKLSCKPEAGFLSLSSTALMAWRTVV